MPTVEIHIYAGLRMSLGWKEKNIEIPGCTSIAGLLKEAGLWDALNSYIEKGYNPIILVNGSNIFLREGLEARVCGGERIDVFPPSAGGLPP